MRLLTETLVIHNLFGDEHGFRLIKEAGFDGVDYSFENLCDEEEVLGENYKEYAYKVKGLLEKNGLVCSQAHAPIVQMYGRRFDETEKPWLQVVRSIEAASILGAEQIVVHATRVPEEVDDFLHTVRYYKSFEPYCKKFGIRIAIENIGIRDMKRECTVERYGTSQKLYGLLAALESSWFVVCVDVGHAACSVGPRPEELIAGLDNNVLRCLHIHDNDFKHDNHSLPYTGEINWDNVMNALKSIKYHGDFALETITYLRKFDTSLMGEALKFAQVIGRYLINKLES